MSEKNHKQSADMCFSCLFTIFNESTCKIRPNMKTFYKIILLNASYLCECFFNYLLYTILQCTKFRQTKMRLNLGYCMQPNVFLHIHIFLFDFFTSYTQKMSTKIQFHNYCISSLNTLRNNFLIKRAHTKVI